MGTAVGLLCVCFTNIFAVHRQRTATHVVYLRRRGMTVPRNSLTCYTARHLRIRRLILFIFAGAVYYNALTNCTTRSYCACLDEITCSRPVSDPTNRLRKTRKKNLPFLFSESGHISLHQIRSREGRSSRGGRETAGVLSLPTAAGAANPSSAERNSLAESRRKTSRPLGGEHADAVRAPQSAGAEKRPPVRGEPACGASSPAQPAVQKKAAR